METLKLKDEQGRQICEKISRVLVEELDTDQVWNKIEDVISDYLYDNKIKENAADLADRIEWAVQVKLRK